ncbi:prophage P2a protein 39 [Lactiplantibacillus plantarum]|nr:phage capsid protein [Lactiplantibacillus plantarum]MCG0635222.1 prophage P2a protein 39 [Lactiplantibacillus plantarum]MCG0641483.1 prophage P2a protein 39 [Lactiplantibacillus plantarum]MCG0644515.1 prophage P2a protein 39 [Lactiplantibacillus plantarum]MCG0650826.1 prophage P2a protein 39 [Lactiplantibacillus plantarum]
MSEESKNQETNTEGGKQSEEQVTFTDEQQAKIDELIGQQHAKWSKKLDQQQADFKQQLVDAQKQAEERAKMTAEQKAEADRKQREAEIAKQNQELATQIQEYKTKSMLLDKGISPDMLPLVMGADEDSTSDNLGLLQKYVDSQVQAATEKLLAGKQAVTTGSNNTSSQEAGTNNPWSKDGWNLTKQTEIYNTDKEQAQKLIASAQPISQPFYVGK